MARMSASPEPVAVTMPDADTVATVELDDCQFAWLVTFWPVPFEKFAVAVNCDEAPTAGAVPLIVTDLGAAPVGAFGVVDGETSPQAHTSSAPREAVAAAPSSWRMIGVLPSRPSRSRIDEP